MAAPRMALNSTRSGVLFRAALIAEAGTLSTLPDGGVHSPSTEDPSGAITPTTASARACLHLVSHLAAVSLPQSGTWSMSSRYTRSVAAFLFEKAVGFTGSWLKKIKTSCSESARHRANLVGAPDAGLSSRASDAGMSSCACCGAQDACICCAPRACICCACISCGDPDACTCCPCICCGAPDDCICCACISCWRCCW